MKVIGVDVAKDFIVAFDGKTFFIYPENKNPRRRIPKRAAVKRVKEISDIAGKDDVVILEQTGTYGIRFAKLFEKAGAKVFIADGKALARFRIGKSTIKNDYVDAQAIREIYFTARRKNVHPFHSQRFQLRTMVRHYIRLNKELTRAVNRFKQQIIHLFPNDNYHNLSRYKLFKNLDEIKNKLKQHPESLVIVALSEIANIKHLTEAVEMTKKEIESVVLNHPDYEILKTFNLGIMQMAALIAYYWDVNLFRSKDSFIGYCLMGVKHEQSGDSVLTNRTDKSRAEIKGIFYMQFQVAHKEISPLKPLTIYMKLKESQYKRRFIKYLDRLLEWIYYGLKYRMTFPEVIDYVIKEKTQQLMKLEEKIKSSEAKEDTFYYKQLLERYRNTSDWLLVCQDISTLLKNRQRAAGVECQDYYKEQILKGESHEMGEKRPTETNINQNAGTWNLYSTGNGRELSQGLYGSFTGRSPFKGEPNINRLWYMGTQTERTKK
ncbi:IS110 family transposase [Desulfurobacterium atlanticum]|uniref:Transposase n=1 Tax=Desulfurobacterium atlanticum TaxID=240169 RepID=A0A238ZJB1_9BACT|nr:transposase [Desulfurobacterium atlanticum]SNR83556.1 Transposase [Desulfurobacterium atlanticum]